MIEGLQLKKHSVIQKQFADRAVQVLRHDETVLGLAVGGSWLTNELDKFSDLDLILVTKEKISNDSSKMLSFAERIGDLLNGFTGEHVGEPRLLICLYDNPLLHVDIKFLTLDELSERIETPVVLFDTDNQLQTVLMESEPNFPYPEYQWIEDRFWIWIHYALLKIGRGEYLEAFDFPGFLRMTVFGPLLHIKNRNLPRGMRKVEAQLMQPDLSDLRSTIPAYDRESLIRSLGSAVYLYKKLSHLLFGDDIVLQKATEEKVMGYFKEIKSTR
jgi:predicted nucleotidyltransferase